ncbi:concanavalin A-like lectin/glucanase domain-containing protein [Stachybotrys elegans]|uniref:Concanavalin A-like lectin/glucanase domain-containing protein n=1 Tax=Stachybotrys elegans TaxID=80388 RepID=A0A8K0WLX5_9HYPO|nr:concanavalin A-like lectin/glucanase domain-containing protein [Stachybotrys elegans]
MLRSVALAAVMGVSSVLAVKCTLDSHCPESAPCCGQYGDCGVGAFCLGGCDPRMSFSMDSCMAAPTCEDKTLRMNTVDNIQHISEYLGDASKADWVASGEPVLYEDNVLLTMAEGTVGTVLSSTAYMWYGSVRARMRTSRGRGVVSAFILFSDVKDEIDYEWVGVDLGTTQTNFYFQGIPDYDNSANISLSNTFSNFHDYEIRWTPDRIEWVVDGEVGRTQLRSDTWNSSAQQWDFPQTPSRVQLSLWPGGLATNAQGTIDWAGGEIDWAHEDVRNTGYFYAMVEEVEIKCWDGNGRLGSNDGHSYTYNSARATNDTVEVGNARTNIASLTATGLDPDKGRPRPRPDNNDDDDNNNDDDDDDEDEDQPNNSVPGGIILQPPRQPGDGENNADGNGDNGGSSGNSGSRPTTDCPVGSFHLNCGEGESEASNTGGGDSGSSKASASALAIIIAGCALYWL